MKKFSLICVLSLLFSINIAFGQKIHKSSVPSLIMNSFQQEFPRAFDIEWNLEQDIYKVGFETGLRRHDNTVWYSKTGKKLKQKSEISKKSLPEKVLNSIKTNFDDYKISDIKVIKESGKEIYTLELKKIYEEWKVSIDSEGVITSKVPD